MTRRMAHMTTEMAPKTPGMAPMMQRPGLRRWPARRGSASSYDGRCARPISPLRPSAQAPDDVSAPSEPPIYKGEPLDAERGPGLGCFWIQVALLTFFLVFTPLTVTWGWDPFISGALLILTLVLLLFSGQTVIFLLRLVAADRRTRRAPLDPKARPTVGQLEDEDADRVEGAAESASEASAPGRADEAPEPPEEHSGGGERG